MRNVRFTMIDQRSEVRGRDGHREDLFGAEV